MESKEVGRWRLEVAEFAVDLEFFGFQGFSHWFVGAAVGFGYLEAEFALAALEVEVFELVEGVVDLVCEGDCYAGGLGGGLVGGLV